MSQSDDHLRSCGVNLSHHARRCLAWIANVDIRSRPGSQQGFLQDNSKDSNLHSFKFADYELRRIAKWFSGLLVDHVCHQPFEMRLAHSFAQNIRAEIELVIAKRRIIQSARVPRVDHLADMISIRFYG